MFNFGSMQTKAQTVMSLPDWPSIIGCCHVARQLVWLGCVCALADKLVPIGDGAAAITAMSFPRIDRAIVCKVTIKRCSLWQALVKDLWASTLLRLPDFWLRHPLSVSISGRFSVGLSSIPQRP